MKTNKQPDPPVEPVDGGGRVIKQAILKQT